MSITAKELAQRLHLSAATVSMVLNRKPGISDETRDLVLSEAKRCGYDFSKIKTPPPGTVYLVVYKKHGEVVGDTRVAAAPSTSSSSRASRPPAAMPATGCSCSTSTR